MRDPETLRHSHRRLAGPWPRCLFASHLGSHVWWCVLVPFILCLGFSGAPAWGAAVGSTQAGGGSRGDTRELAGTLRVTVVDQTGAVIVGAGVSIAADDGATGAVSGRSSVITDGGGASFPNLVPGSYTLEAAFPGFKTQVLPRVRVRAGENRQVLVLRIEAVEAEVTVAPDPQQAAADPRGNAFGTAFLADEIEALSDDPDTLQQQLNDIAGPGASVRVDGFSSSGLPPKAQIRSIRIARDQFSAEYHEAGGTAIEVVTQPGLGPIRFRFNALNRQGNWGGRSPFVEIRGPERNTSFGLGLGGALIKERSSFNVNVSGSSGFDTPNQYTALPGGGRIARALPIRASRTNTFISGQVDYALSASQMLRFGYTHAMGRSENAGVGGFNEPERAFSTTNGSSSLRVQHSWPVGRRGFSRTRLQFGRSHTDADAATEARTIRVMDAFVRGGAQRSGGDRSRTLDLESDLDYVHARHSLRVGATVQAGWYASDSFVNYLGEYTFETLDAYIAGQPSLFTRRVGDPRIAYAMVRAAGYVQDDVRLRRGLTVSAGFRYERQSHVADGTGLAPRAGVTWSPLASGATTLRGSAGLFYDWLPTSTFEQAQRIDGLHQREISIADPAFPEPGGGGAIPPTNRYVFGDRYRLPRIGRVSAGVEQRIIANTRVSATYSVQNGSRAARGLNLNAPIDGARPDPQFANVIEVVSDASYRRHELAVDAAVHPGALVPAFTGPRISATRVTFFAAYAFARHTSNTEGPFSPPATGRLSDDWGPAPRGSDVRHRLNLSLNNQVVRNLLVGLNLNVSSAPPYTELTGRDDNGDGLFIDRPAGVGRNSRRASGQATVNANIGYVVAFGSPPPAGGDGARLTSPTTMPGRYRLQFILQVLNLMNRRNYVGYSGVLTSPFFGQPTSVSGMRRIDLGATLNF